MARRYGKQAALFYIARAQEIVDLQNLRPEWLRPICEASEEDPFDVLITDPAYAGGGLNAAASAKPPSQKYVQGGAQLDVHFVGDERDQGSHLK
ncbi:hypothetical protein XFF6990_200541 [Xanthomonas citri pv. fuscans]|uniref:Uncharacterized protein n=1 Tax=Xanthomonas campestris pv. phaseoli TaxID=317013 RepID=A0A7Z7NJK7_XANCH|nr:hypothetical protein XFF6990_200541 [Xanthomonas citri pv. fuscans]SOO25776.1 hypothetical protein XFF6991_480101 [Xanthomonas phaseoli pv. phaseoli]